MIEIIPAIDIIDGKCVRLSQGDYERKTVYNDNPVEVAMMFEDWGMKRLHLVDLDGAKSKHIVNYRTIEAIASKTSLIIDMGGGIKSDEDINIAIESGASMLTVGSIAVSNPELMGMWVEKYGAERIILGADVKNGLISINGWKEEGDDKLIPFIRKYTDMGIKNVLCTDISRDGMMQGPAVDLYKDIITEFPHINLIASGGVSCMDDIAALDMAGIPSVVVGKAIYEGKICLRKE